MTFPGCYYLIYNIFQPNELVCDYADYADYEKYYPNKFVTEKVVTYRDNVMLKIGDAYYRQTFKKLFGKEFRKLL